MIEENNFVILKGAKVITPSTNSNVPRLFLTEKAAVAFVSQEIVEGRGTDDMYLVCEITQRLKLKRSVVRVSTDT